MIGTKIQFTKTEICKVGEPRVGSIHQIPDHPMEKRFSMGTHHIYVN